MGFNSIFRALQVPAYTASVSLLVPKDQLGRANGIMQLEATSSYLLSPILAGWLLEQVGIVSVMLIDLATFLFAVSHRSGRAHPQAGPAKIRSSHADLPCGKI